MKGARPLVVGISGPDGAGKSTLVRALARTLRRRGVVVATAYCYGCAVCRRAGGTGGAGGTAGAGGVRMRRSGAHALVDCAEAAARLRTARASGADVVLTDRGPLDTLVKFAPRAGSSARRALTRLAGVYGLTLLMDAPAGVLAERDGEHGEAVSEGSREGYGRWARRLGSRVAVLDAHAAPGTVAAEAAARILALLRQRHMAATAGRAGAPPARAPRVVFSVYDSPDNPFYAGGGALQAERVARRLHAAGLDVTIVTAGRRSSSDVRDGVRHVRLPLWWAGPRFGQLLWHVALGPTARRIPHDLWIEGFTPPFSTSLVPLFTRAPVLGVAQSLSGAPMARHYGLPFALAERVGLRCYRDVVVLNDADADTVRRHSRGRVHVIPAGVGARPVDERRLGAGEHILFLGRIDVREKGLDLLLAAYAKACPELPLVLAGAGTRAEERRLDTLLEDVGNGVRRVGAVAGRGKGDLLERSAFVVLPSRNEAFGIAALEGMAYGKPVVHFDLPTLRWMLGGGGVGVPPFDVDAFAATLRRLASDGQWRRGLGLQACLTARQHSWEETTGRYLDLVRHLLAEHGITAQGAPSWTPPR